MSSSHSADSKRTSNEACSRVLLAFATFAIGWFAVWTITVNVLVLSGTKFQILPWCLLSTCAVSAVAMLVGFDRLYDGLYVSPTHATITDLPSHDFRLIVLLGLAACSAAIVQKAAHPAVLILAMTITSTLAYLFSNCRPAELASEESEHLARDFAFVCIVIALLYYCGHRPDWDDANFLNLAAKAPHAVGEVFQYDTMVGNGPHPIHLPTYRVQSYELLGACIAHLTGLEPAQVFHLLLPMATIPLLACALVLVIRPSFGSKWVAVSLFALASLYADSQTFLSWGTNGLSRFQEGKGPLVVLVPLLTAGLTIHWFNEGRRATLAALTLVNVCAIGVSANGIYVGPGASGLVALAFLVGDFKYAMFRTPLLGLTLIYPAAIGGVVLWEHLALPSEVTTPQLAFDAFRNVVGWRAEGLASLTLMPMLPIVARRPANRKASATYLPAALLVLMSPVGWRAASEITGNLGYRLFWAIPGSFINAAVAVTVLQGFRLRKSWHFTGLAAVSLLLGIVLNQVTAEPDLRVQWHQPGLRAPRDDYVLAHRLAETTPTGCKALVPERYAVWMSGLRTAPYLVAVRRLYLEHYRFSEPPAELATRWSLFNLVNGGSVNQRLISPQRLRTFDMSIGLIAADPNARNLDQVKALAKTLTLESVRMQGSTLIVWTGPCAKTHGL